MNIKRTIKFCVIGLINLFLIFVIGCKKDNLTKIPKQNADTSLYTDVVNKDVYKIVKIGNQWWMAENLRATKYRNGDSIPHIQSNTSLWNNDSIGACCIYSIMAPGLLYNWYAVNNPNNLAPAGWHIPSDEEWKTLEEFLGMSPTEANNINWRGSNEAIKLKKEAQLGWQKYSDETWPTNESGFSAVGGGCRLFNGFFGLPGLLSTGFWWTTTTNESNNKAWYRYMDYKSSQVFRNYVPKTYGFSVRCVKD